MTIPLPSSSPPPNPRRKKTRGDRVARRTELAAQTVAGGIGTAFGAAKLRDSYKEENKRVNARKVHRVVAHGERIARARGVPRGAAAQIAHAVEHGKPGFKPLVALAGAGAVATGAHRYQLVSHYVRTKRDGLHKSEPHRAPSPPIRVRATPPPKHAARPYVGRRRALTRTDALRAKAVMHSAKLYEAAGFLSDLHKAACCTGDMAGVPRSGFIKGVGKVRVVGYHGNGKFHVIDRNDSGRIASTETLKFHKAKKAGDVSKSAFGVDHISKAGNLPVLARKAEVVGRNVGPQAAKSRRGRNLAIAGGAAAATGAAGAGAVHARRRRAMTTDSGGLGKSAFFAPIAKDDDTPPTPNAKPSAGRRATAAVAGGWHPIVAGKPGQKTAALGSTLGHGVGGAVAGEVAGAALGAATRKPAAVALGAGLGGLTGAQAGFQRAVTTNSRKGRYKPEAN